ncbi:BatA domain-containing protein [Coralloluteibacterium thermophilus]|uniref:BatA domain-containing protein n=1 Tax=Coralloluteibacterium thermophilum TaxID=2707049 RepID=A0ABV9NJ55_9GAMM
MSPTLLVPAALAALAALAVPLLIHLIRRADERVVDFAALRWLRVRRRPQRRVLFEERALLVARLLLVALLALFLAAPALVQPPGGGAWVLVVPGANPAAARGQAMDAEWRWLAPGFPPLSEPQPAARQPVASLLREADARLPADARLTVVVPEILDGLDGARPALAREVAWHVVPGAPARGETAGEPPRLAVRYPADRADSLRYLRAAARAWGAEGAFDAAQSDAVPGGDSDTLVWLHAEVPAAVRAWAEEGRTLVVEADAALEGEGMPVPAWRDAGGAVLAEEQPLGAGRLLRLAAPLRPEALPVLLDPAFPGQLRALLQASPMPARAPAPAVAPARAEAAVRGLGAADGARSLQPWLALLIGLVLLVERLLASRRQRWRA